MKTIGEKVDAAAEHAIDMMGAWFTVRKMAASKEEKDAIKAQAIIALRQVIFEAISETR